MIEGVGDLRRLLENVRDFACECVENTPGGPVAVCHVYHGAGDPPDSWCCDAVTVWVERFYPVYQGQFPAEYGGVTASCANPGPAVSIAVRLRRPCWPTITDQSPHIPETTVTEPAALQLAEDGSQLWCCLVADLTSLDSTIMEGPAQGLVSMGALVPDQNLGGCAGWTTRFTVSLSGCC